MNKGGDTKYSAALLVSVWTDQLKKYDWAHPMQNICIKLI